MHGFPQSELEQSNSAEQLSVRSKDSSIYDFLIQVTLYAPDVPKKLVARRIEIIVNTFDVAIVPTVLELQGLIRLY